jgi:inorganic pyrophosphatase
VKVGEEHWFQPAVGAMPMPGRVIDVTPSGVLTMADRHGNEWIIPACLLAGY